MAGGSLAPAGNGAIAVSPKSYMPPGFGPDFFRAVSVCSGLSALATPGLIFPPRTYAAPAGVEAEAALRLTGSAVARILQGIATRPGNGPERVISRGFFPGASRALRVYNGALPGDSALLPGAARKEGSGRKRRVKLTFNSSLTTRGGKLTSFFNRLTYLYITNFSSENRL